MLKRALIDNKIANINDKNCSLCIVLTAMYQKLQIIKSDITQHLVDF